MKHIGIFPGTFDPVHPGHVAFALEALRACKLDEVLFLPEHTPRAKTGVSSLSQRVGVLQDSLKTTPGLRVMQLASRQFTAQDTLPELKLLFPDSTLTLLLGSDVVRTFTYRWEGLPTLLGEMPLTIGMRGEDSADEVLAILAGLEKTYGLQIAHTILRAEHADLASSQIRLKPSTAEA